MAIIKLRRGPAAEWTSVNPTLASGEVGVELDTYRFKIGTGLVPWNALGYFVSGGAQESDLAQMIQDHVDNPDAHPQYITSTDLQVHIDNPDAHPQYLSDADLAAHVAAPDPHPQYTTDPEVELKLQNHVMDMDPHPNMVSLGSGHVIYDEGVQVINRGILNFVGDGVTVEDDLDNEITNVVVSAVMGPAGPPGTAYLNAQWNFNQNTAVSPASGTMRMNATTYAATTTLWVHEVDRDGLDRSIGLSLAEVGDQIIMQSAQGRAVWNIIAQADSGAYRTFTVTLVESTGTRPSASSVTTLYFASPGAEGLDQTAADALYVNTSGDTMTGTLAVPTLAAPPGTLAFIGSATTQNGNGTSVAVTLPSSIIAGDLLLVLFTQNDYSSGVTPPSGWAVPAGFGGWGSHVGNNGNGLVGGAWYYKIATAGDANAVSTWLCSQTRLRISVLVFRNAGMPTQFVDGGNSLTIAANALTVPVASNGMMIAAHVQRGDGAAAVVTPGTVLASHKSGASFVDTHCDFWGSAVTAGQQSPAATFSTGDQVGTGLLFVPVDTSNSRIVSTSNIDFSGTKGPINLRTPATSTDAATKGYVDAAVSGVGGGHTVQDEGTPLTARTGLNFVGAGVTATDDAANNRINVTVPGGSGSTIPSGSTAKDMLRWAEPGTFANINYTVAGTNGLLNWCRGNAVTPTATQSSLLAAGYEADKAIDGLLTNFSGSDNLANSWWRIDFGATKAVLPTSLSIRGRTSGGNHPRLFNVDGSNDGTTWTTLYSTGGTPNPITDATWVNVLTPASVSYRYLRIINTGTDTTGANFLVMAEVEIYGKLLNPALSPSWVVEADAPSDGASYSRKNGAWAAHVNMIVLAAGAPVPGGTPAGTVIVRTV